MCHFNLISIHEIKKLMYFSAKAIHQQGATFIHEPGVSAMKSLTVDPAAVNAFSSVDASDGEVATCVSNGAGVHRKSRGT